MAQSGQTSQPRLPLELQDLTLQCLSHDRPALLRSSLVCKDWRNICAAMVFADIDLSSRWDEKPGARFSRFCDLTKASSYPPFLANIQHLTLDGDAKPKRILALKAERLGGVTSLCVAGRSRTNAVADADCYSALSKQFPGLKRLDLVTAFFTKRSTLLEFISSFPDLRSLALGNMKWFVFFGYQHIPVSPDAGPLPPIEHLRIILKTMEHIDKFLLAWLGEQLQARASLRSLEYSVLAASPPSNYNTEFLQRVSSSLEKMTLDFEMGVLANVVFRNPTCIYSRLTTLTLGFPLWEVKYGSKALDAIHPKRGRGEAYRFPVQLSSLTDLSEALQHVDAPTLRDLTLRLYAEPDIEKDGRAFCSLGTLRSIDLSKLDQRLSTPLCPFPNLRNVTLACGAIVAPGPFHEFFFFEGDHPGATPYYARAPVPRTGGQFEDVASAFLLAAFPLVMARKDMRLRVVKGI